MRHGSGPQFAPAGSAELGALLGSAAWAARFDAFEQSRHALRVESLAGGEHHHLRIFGRRQSSDNRAVEAALLGHGHGGLTRLPAYADPAEREGALLLEQHGFEAAGEPRACGYGIVPYPMISQPASP